jgi:hypothetical protein
MKLSKETIWYGTRTFIITTDFNHQGIQKFANNHFTCDRENYLQYFDFLGEEFVNQPKQEVEQPKEEVVQMIEKPITKKMIKEQPAPKTENSSGKGKKRNKRK